MHVMVVKAVRAMPPPVAHMRVAFSPTAGGGAGKGIAGSEVLTIGVWIELRAAAGVVDHRLRLHGVTIALAATTAGPSIANFILALPIARWENVVPEFTFRE
jgi:hypothetical protein